MFLKEKIRVNQTELMNRIVLPPMASEKSEGGQVTDALCEYYREIVKDKATGLVIIEHSYVEIDGKASQGQLSIADDSVIEGLKNLSRSFIRGGEGHRSDQSCRKQGLFRSDREGASGAECCHNP